MLHAIVGLLYNSAHIDSYLKLAHMTMAWSGAYTASDKHPAPEEGPAIQD